MGSFFPGGGFFAMYVLMGSIPVGPTGFTLSPERTYVKQPQNRIVQVLPDPRTNFTRSGNAR